MELGGRQVVKSRCLNMSKESVKISSTTYTKPKYESYTYNAHKALEILDELFAQDRVRHDFALIQSLSRPRGKSTASITICGTIILQSASS